VISQTWNVLAFKRNSLSRLFNPFMGPVSGRGEHSRPGWARSLARAGVRTGAMFALLALSAVAQGIGQTAGSRIDQADSNANPSQESVTVPPADPDREAWQMTMLNIPRPQETCSTATYPEQQWREVPCEAPPDRPVTLRDGVRPDIVGGGGPGSDLLLATTNGAIAEGEGSFDKVTGVTSETGNRVRNSFSLQLNTNIFQTKSCGSAKDCYGWVQFVYDSFAHTAFVQYWLLFYGDSCPAGWTSDGGNDGSCFRNSHAVSTPAVTIAELQQTKLYGYIGGYFGNPGDDLVTLQIGDKFYTEASGDPIQGAVKGWSQMEFNVFGDGGGLEAVFNPGSTIQVRESMILGTGTEFECSGFGSTGETNSLTLSAKTPLVAAVGPPSLVFIESNVKGTQPGSCANAALIGEPHRIWPPFIADEH